MKPSKNILQTLILAAATTGLIACGGGDGGSSSSTTISGTAATGLAFSGQVVAVNAAGEVSEPVTVAADGSFSVTLPSGGPYLLKAYNDTETLISFSPTGQGNVNINQLTTLAMFDAYDQGDLLELFESWSDAIDGYEGLNEDIAEAAAQVAANFKNALLEEGLDETTISSLNVFTYGFTPAYFLNDVLVPGDAFDGLLDSVGFSYDCTTEADQTICNYALDYGDSIFTYLFDISTEGFNVTFSAPTTGGGSGGNTGGGSGGGTYNLTITTTLAGGPGIESTIKAIEKPANESEFCVVVEPGGVLTTSGFVSSSCTFDGTTGIIKGSITAGSSALNYTYKYVYTTI